MSTPSHVTAPAIGDEWRTFTDALGPIAERVAQTLRDPDDPQIRHELYRQLFSMISTGYWSLLYQNPDNPDFVPFWYNFGAPNPDDLYTVTPIRGDGVYRISGTRGSTRIVTFSIGSGPFLTRGDGDRMGPNLAEYDLDEIDHNPDGTFEVVLSAERPDGYTGAWWELAPTARNIMVRQRYYDWLGEEAGRLAIDRIDVPIAKPRRTPEQLTEDLNQLAVWTENWSKWSIEFANRSRRLGFINQVEVNGLHEVGGYAIQKYVMGVWDLQPGEALVYETEIPAESRYWAIQLLDELYSTLDHLNLSRQTSLNGHSAFLDSDGRFRAVLCAEDPGVPNWLDTCDYRMGGIFGRWQQCSSYPVPTVTVVPLEDLRKHLPDDHPTVTPAERDQALRTRRRSYQLRHRWN